MVVTTKNNNMLKLFISLGVFVVAVNGIENECCSKVNCGLGKSCDDGVCYDPCLGYCGGNTTCTVFRHHPLCTCVEGYKGNPLLGCTQGAGCSVNVECADNQACVSEACVDPCQGACDEDLFCEVKGHTATCLKPTSVQSLRTRSDLNYEYSFLPITSGSRITFRVKTKSDAHILLSTTSNPTGDDPYYEVVVGGWSNTRSSIRKDRTLDPKVDVSTVSIVSQFEFRGFWIECSSGYIAVGKEGEDNPFMSWTDPEPLADAQFVGFATGFGANGWWYVYEKGCAGSSECADDRVCTSGVCVNPCHIIPNTCEAEYVCQVASHAPSCYKPGNILRVSTTNVNFDYIYFPAPTAGSVINFKVKASNDAHFILTESSNPDVTTDNFLEVVIGGWSNVYSVIRNKREGGEKDREYFPSIVRNDQYQGFWIQYIDGQLLVGKENEKTAFLRSADTVPLDFQYFGIATGFGSEGEWILYD